MRILALRGQNLASLAGPFEVDFEAPPLLHEGLCAISGATGAGKSTLLDALCLALYNDTPRLCGADGKLAQVGSEAVTVRDPRNLLRRGTSEGFAEVDFQGTDGEVYRARWSVRRARGKRGGKLQPVEMRLCRRDDATPVGDGTRDVLLAIEAKVGLSFAQFTRAVLLAQNQFFAFLQASDNERAELLEALTGTEALAEVSRRAFYRAKSETAAHLALRQQQDNTQPLAAEARAALEAQAAEARTEVSAAEQKQQRLEQERAWHQAWARAVAEEEDARTAFARAQAEKANAAGRASRLALVEAAADARPALALFERHGQDRKRAEVALRQATERAQAAGVAAQAAAKAFAEAAQAQVAVEARHASALPLLHQARALDTELDAQTRVAAEAAALQANAQNEQRQLETTLQQRRQRQAELQRSVEQADVWLREHATSRALGERWDRWSTLLTQAERLEKDHEHAQGLLAQANTRRTRAERAVAKAQDHRRQAADVLALADKHWVNAQKALADIDGPLLERRRAELVAYAEDLAEALRLCQTEAIRQEQRTESAERLVALAARKASALTRAAALVQERPRLEGALQQAERAVAAADAACAAEIVGLRQRLQDGEPCPVCGATTHPWAEHDPRQDELRQALVAQASQCRSALDAAISAHAVADTEAKTALAQHAETAAVLAKAEAELEATARAWCAHRLWPKVAELAVAERSTWLSQQQAEVRAARDRIDQEALAYRQALAGRDAAAAKREQALKTDAVAAESERAAEAEHTAAAAAVTSATDQCAVLQSQREHVHHELDGAFPSTAWRERFAEDARRFVAACLQEAETWQAQAALLTEHKAEQAKVDVAVQGLAATVTAAVARTGEAERRGRDETARFLTLQQERARLFEGRAVAAVEAGLQADLAAAKANTEQRDRLARQSADERARCEAALASAQTELLAQRSACVDAEAQVTTWLSAFNAQHAPTPPLTLDTLRELLSHDDAWKKAEREALAALEAGVAAASAVLGERAARREVLAGERLSEASQSEVEAAWSNGKDGLGQARALLTRLEVEVQADNDRRAERQNLERQVTAQGERAALWARVNDLIGSADGKKLRNFAQELTLDVLLCYANRHLEVLARRYRLLRVQGTLGLLVNDDDMGGEVRSTRSLSGGETFLVSLSLALGLASLSSHRVRVESLFIDEGFGSLDADTLAVAMDALDRLHAQGRRVCVISHVQEMTERIAVRIHIQKGTGGKSELVLID